MTRAFPWAASIDDHGESPHIDAPQRASIEALFVADVQVRTLADQFAIDWLTTTPFGS